MSRKVYTTSHWFAFMVALFGAWYSVSEYFDGIGVVSDRYTSTQAEADLSVVMDKIDSLQDQVDEIEMHENRRKK